MPADQHFTVATLGIPQFSSPLILLNNTANSINSENTHILYKPYTTSNTTFNHAAASSLQTNAHLTAPPNEQRPDLVIFERARIHPHLFFDPTKVVAGIVTCGGLCPGLNNVIRGLVHCLHYRYKINSVLGFMYGYEGLNPIVGSPPVPLNPLDVKDIHRFGGSILKTSRGPQPVNVMVDYLVKLGVNMLFAIGGDGTQRGALAIADEIKMRNLLISVVGIPKTIDNDIAYCSKTFGFDTAVSMALDPIQAAHEEARSSRGGIGIVKLMGRYSGFIALHAALASGDVNLLLLPEVLFSLDHILQIVKDRLRDRDHLVIVIAEGAGQDLMVQGNDARDASGNILLQDIGLFLKHQIAAHLTAENITHTIKYIDPSYTIRSAPACGTDAVFTVSLAHQAVHAAMAGKTGCLVGMVQDDFVLIPIAKAVEHRKIVDVDSLLYQTVLDLTGMARDLVNQ